MQHFGQHDLETQTEAPLTSAGLPGNAGHDFQVRFDEAREHSEGIDKTKTRMTRRFHIPQGQPGHSCRRRQQLAGIIGRHFVKYYERPVLMRRSLQRDLLRMSQDQWCTQRVGGRSVSNLIVARSESCHSGIVDESSSCSDSQQHLCVAHSHLGQVKRVDTGKP